MKFDVKRTQLPVVNCLSTDCQSFIFIIEHLNYFNLAHNRQQGFAKQSRMRRGNASWKHCASPFIDLFGNALMKPC